MTRRKSTRDLSYETVGGERAANVPNPDAYMELGPVDDTKRDYMGLAPRDSHEQSTDTEAKRKAYETVVDERTTHKPLMSEFLFYIRI